MTSKSPTERTRLRSLARAGIAVSISLISGSFIGMPAMAVPSAPQHSLAVAPSAPLPTPGQGPRPAAKTKPQTNELPNQQHELAPAVAPTPAAAAAGPAPDALIQGSGSAPMPGNAPDAETKKAAMRSSIPAGGAEMGQRSSRVLATKKDGTAAPASGRAVGGAVNATVPMTADTSHWRPSVGVEGQDVSAHQGNVDWQGQWSQGVRWAYVKASEGNYYVNENYTQQYNGSRDAGMIRGAYHFAIPNWSSGADQARYFVANGGGWTADGYTLPPVLDIEYNPYAGRTINGFYFGNTCYDMSQAQLGQWAADFGNTVKALTGRFPVIYSTTDWWNTCVGNSTFGSYPLWIASYWNNPTNSPGSLPASWNGYTMWQYSSTGPFEGDSNIFNGSYDQLRTYARGVGYPSNPSIKSEADILVTNASGRLDNFPADGQGNITGPVTIGSGWAGAKSIYVVDWNQDGVQDILSQWPDGSLKVFPGAPGGGFYAPIQVGKGWQEMSLTVGWWNSGDGYPGVLGQDAFGDIYRYPNAGGGVLGAGVKIGSGFTGHQINQIDFDGDGSQDLVTRTTDGTLRLYRSDGLGNFVNEPARVIGSGWDGMTAVSSSTNYSGAASQGLVARAANGDLDYYPAVSRSWGSQSLIGLGWNDVTLISGAPVDVESTLGVDAPDVLAIRPDANLYRYPGSGSTSLLPQELVGTGWAGLKAGFVTDWNGDGTLDVVAQWSDGRLSVYPGRNGRGFGAPISLGTNWAGWTLTVGTWKTTDGHPGIVGYDSTGRLFYFNNLSGGTVSAGIAIGVGWTGLDIVQMDFDKDSKPDLLAKTRTGDLKLYRSNGAGNFIPETPEVVGTGWNIISSFGAIRDFSNPGSTGLVARTTTGELRYYPVGQNKAWGTPMPIGTGWNGLKILAPAAK
ncbi:GH25 family lysozyme [Arthrobacter sp. efr-133-TYG-104]|uniref:GH25 family lysozyme n=1 Tax=Arthrobacter sp. efr-133-TYG-104 TaxID=3040324 RepID=UPI00254BA3BE|nr:GH25 family lysozyme [Arthrobacter sp. efr-133-TYG-104]